MAERIRPSITCEPSLTKQSFKDECDINFIMNKWKRTGEIPAASVGTLRPSYGDFSNPSDYMDACNAVLRANEAFAQLPSFLRDRFANQPANLLGFLANPENQDEAVKLGLAEPPTEPEPTPPVVTPPEVPPVGPAPDGQRPVSTPPGVVSGGE